VGFVGANASAVMCEKREPGPASLDEISRDQPLG